MTRRRSACRAAGPVLVAVIALVACTPPGLPDPLPGTAPAASSGPAPATSATPSAIPTGTPVTALPSTEGPAVSSTAEPPERPAEVLLVGVDRAPPGFNPHALADFSPTSQAVSELVLPAVSRIGTDGTLSLDPELMDSAEVTSSDPFTVTYRIRTDAAWSDGTPVTAADFAYLADSMSTEAGAVAPAGYRLVSQVVSRDAGKTVDVEFSEPVADWLGMFSPLLPSHLMRDVPGGWGLGLADGLPVSGGQYKMAAWDPVTGELMLVRNDKYWGDQPGPDEIRFRVGDPATLTEALRRGDLDLLLTAAAVDTSADGAAGWWARSFPASSVTSLLLSATLPPTAGRQVRRAVAASLDRPAVLSALSATSAGGPVQDVTSLVAVDPWAEPGDVPPELAHDPVSAGAMLDEAGLARSDGVYRGWGGALARLTLAVPAGRPDLELVAWQLRDDLGDAGLDVTIIRDSPDSVVQSLAQGTVSMALLDRPAVVSPALTLASQFGCSGTEPGLDGDLPIGEEPVDGPVPAGNPMGYCEPAVEPVLRELIRGESHGEQLDPATAALEARLLGDLPVIPLARPVWQVTAGSRWADRLRTEQVPVGWSWTGPLARAGSWAVPD